MAYWMADMKQLMAETRPRMFLGAREYAIPYAVTLTRISVRAVMDRGRAVHQIEMGETKETPSASTQVRDDAWSPQGPVV